MSNRDEEALLDEKIRMYCREQEISQGEVMLAKMTKGLNEQEKRKVWELANSPSRAIPF